MSKTIALVACVGGKRPEPSPAADLYMSDWFLKASAYARMIADEWYILSAKYGLVRPTAVIAPYNVTLNRMRKAERTAWAEQVLKSLCPLLTLGDEVIFLAGKNYRADLIQPIRDLGCKVRVPMEGLGIGQQLSWLLKHLEQGHAK